MRSSELCECNMARKYKNRSCKCSRFQLTSNQTFKVFLGHPVYKSIKKVVSGVITWRQDLREGYFSLNDSLCVHRCDQRYRRRFTFKRRHALHVLAIIHLNIALVRIPRMKIVKWQGPLGFKDAAAPRFGHSNVVFSLFLVTNIKSYLLSIISRNLKVVVRACYGAYFVAYVFRYLAPDFVSGRPAWWCFLEFLYNWE